ncbi:hypothetical protein PV08_10301 [Exophiala spinifera]|uniref:Glycosyl transferase family 1 domain-containing protein n=1 Tax=Exophiala spinifera TaxID=91928 RepID=A0A0D1ZDH8_9EURO|nr:uncharacterized protein PV08_10301 [Exophiala spinifera]KIW11002.1 hypothetical protein PV08_10301 [Exophiala spinifera]
MRVFLFQTAKGLSSSSGGYKSNLSLLKYLAHRKHAVAQLCYVWDSDIDSYYAEMAAAGLEPDFETRVISMPADDSTEVLIRTYTFTTSDGVRNVAFNASDFMKALPDNVLARDTARFIEENQASVQVQVFLHFLDMHIYRFEPTHVIFNDGLMLKATSIIPSLRDVSRNLIVHTAEQLPFGPFAGGIPGASYSTGEHKLMRGVDAIWAVSECIRNYAQKHGQIESTFHIHHPWTYLDSKTHALPTRRENWDKTAIGFVNPCPVKGSSIFRDLAKRCPEFKFVALSSWGINPQVEAELREVPNIDLRQTASDMEKVWSEIKLLLVPSLWLEAWGIVVVEAQLRGIPVISSDAGAIPEAKLGIPVIIPVNSLTGERSAEGGYAIPEQDIEPWKEAVTKLMTDKDWYEEIAERARTETASWLAEIDHNALESWLLKSTKPATMHSNMKISIV